MNIITDNFDVIENDVTITDFNIIYNFDIIINNYLGTNEDNT